MANYSAKIINNAISALAAQQALLAANSNNIANVNTPGYSRRVVTLENRVSAEGGVSGQIGSGVDVQTIQRMADKFLQNLMQQSAGERGAADAKSNLLSRAESLFALDGASPTISSSLTAFFASANDLSSNPASIELRTNFLQRAQDVVTTISSTYRQLATLQREADQRLVQDVNTVNNITAQIGELNQQIAQRESNGVDAANDERDRRDVLLNQLSEKISFSTIELADGSISVQLSNGFALVNGSNVRQIETTQTPSFNGSVPQGLDGAPLHYIVFDYGTAGSPSHFDMTEMFAAGEGSIAGLLSARGVVGSADTSPFQADGVIVDLASQVEGIARGLITTVNQYYLGYDPSLAGNGDENSGVAGFQARTGDLNGNTPSVYGLFTFTSSVSRDVNNDGLPNDLAAYTAANGVQSFASIMTLAISDPRNVAAAIDTNATAGATSFSPGDGRNMATLASMRSQSMTLSVGGYSYTGTLDEAYNNLVTTAGNEASRAKGDYSTAEQRFLTVSSQRDEVSGVSLDEEFSNMMRFQRAYQASARVLGAADKLLEQIIGLL